MLYRTHWIFIHALAKVKVKYARDDVSWGSSPLKLERNGGEKKKTLPFSHPFADIDCSYLDFLYSIWPVCTKIKLGKEFRQPGHQFFFLIFLFKFRTRVHSSLSLFFFFFPFFCIVSDEKRERWIDETIFFPTSEWL